MDNKKLAELEKRIAALEKLVSTLRISDSTVNLSNAPVNYVILEDNCKADLSGAQIKYVVEGYAGDSLDSSLDEIEDRIDDIVSTLEEIEERISDAEESLS